MTSAIPSSPSRLCKYSIELPFFSFSGNIPLLSNFLKWKAVSFFSMRTLPSLLFQRNAVCVLPPLPWMLSLFTHAFSLSKTMPGFSCAHSGDRFFFSQREDCDHFSLNPTFLPVLGVRGTDRPFPHLSCGVKVEYFFLLRDEIIPPCF